MTVHLHTKKRATDYLLRKVPPELHRLLRLKAAAESQTIRQVIFDALYVATKGKG